MGRPRQEVRVGKRRGRKEEEGKRTKVKKTEAA
jgi:hypothetical protein